MSSLDRIKEWLAGGPDASFSMGQFLFARVLGLGAFLAFWSLWRQVDGLYGWHGILPIEDFLAQATEWGRRVGQSPQRVFPSLLWITGAADATLRGLSALGMLAAGFLVVGVAPRLAIAVLWISYLSFVSVGQIFMGYQWDGLLLEALAVGFFFVPWDGLPRRMVAPNHAGRWLVWILTFKLMFLAGWVKLFAHNSAWTDFSALDFHFWTQPIPNFVAPYANALPAFIRGFGVLFTLIAETLAPLLILAPRRFRHAGAMGMIALQIAIVATGTYGFFNIVAVALCLSLFDDAFFGRFAFLSTGSRSPRPPALQWSGAAIVACVGVLVATATFLPEKVGDLVAPLRTFNGYGLFADMTRERPEIVVEWSPDGERWIPYDYEYKPTAVDESLRVTAFWMPRLDWQLWFAALRGCPRATWLQSYAARLLEGSPEVQELHEGVGPPVPPMFVRMRKYHYRFADDGAVWERSGGGLFCPVFALDRDGALITVESP